MKIPRDITILIHFLFDQCTPPILRDQKWFMYVPFKLLFGKKADLIFNFKKKFLNMTDREIEEFYREISDIPIMQRATDINRKCIDLVLESVRGRKVLDIACGRGHLSSLLAENYIVTGCDFVIDESTRKNHPRVRFREAEISKLPFKNKEFDTTICAHTLEHVKDIQKSLAELRRVTSKRLIVIIPRQRPYRYTFDPHIHFFPYEHTLMQVIGFHGKKQSLEVIGGDFFYVEDY